MSTLTSFMKSVSGRILGGQLKNCISSDRDGLDRTEFVNFYRSTLNQQSNQSQALTFLFFKARKH